MEKIWIEVGGYKAKFLKTLPENVRKIFVFEPNPKFKNNMLALQDRYDFIYYPHAAWTYDGEIEFTIGKGDMQGSSIYNKKHATGDKIKVQCVDFSRWILDNFTIDDYIILNMDCEGAEYEILNKMIQDETINFIKELTVEFHARRFLIKSERIKYTEIHKNLLNYLKTKKDLKFTGYGVKL